MCGPRFCSMKITKNDRKFAAEHEISEDAALEEGLNHKATQVIETGGEVYFQS